MAEIAHSDLIRRLKNIKLATQRSLENIGPRQDVSEGKRLLTHADRELLLLIRELEAATSVLPPN